MLVFLPPQESTSKVYGSWCQVRLSGPWEIAKFFIFVLVTGINFLDSVTFFFSSV